MQSARFYVPALGAIALLGAWLLVRVPRRASLAAATSVAVVAAMFGLGVWSFGDMRVNQGPQQVTARILAPGNASSTSRDGRAPAWWHGSTAPRLVSRPRTEDPRQPAQGERYILLAGLAAFPETGCGAIITNGR